MKQWTKGLAFCLTALLLLAGHVNAHNVSYPIIVDTDMAVDDIRAVTLLLNSDAGQVRLMVASDGIRPPDEGAANLKAMLQYFGRTDVPVAMGRILEVPPPEFRGLIKDIVVPGAEKAGAGTDAQTPAGDMIVKAVEAAKDPVIYLCLGPMTNLSDALAINPGIKDNISTVLYYGAHPNAEQPGWNTQRDAVSAGNAFASGLRIYALCPPESEWLPFDKPLYEKICRLDTPAGRLIQNVHETPEINALMAKNHFSIWDELVVLYMGTPSSFDFAKQPGNDHIRMMASFDKAEVLDAYLQGLGLAADLHLSPRYAVVLKGFPRDADIFRSDVAPHVQNIIDKHGMEEWKACVLTNEFHRHLGMYSIIGAKMGVRAREVLEAPFDSLEVTSFAGNKPPFSCLNDGLQVSTGASLGRGTITVLGDKTLPKAAFYFDDTKLTLTLKAEIWNQIKSDIGALIKEFGGTTPEYFARVRELSIKQWEAWNRKTIFEEELFFERKGK